jgi:ABC-type amino acid transport system permease subunit
VNAARASAVASFIGTPELLTALTDIASVTTERRTTFAILLVFYLAIVMMVVWLAGILTRHFATQPEVAA